MARTRSCARDISATETAHFLDKTLRETPLQQKLIASVAKRYPQSANAGEAEDFVQDMLVAMLERDTIARRHANPKYEGKEPTVGQMGWWASNTAQKTIRREARNPVTRALRGAKTQIDLLKEKQGVVDTKLFAADPSTIAMERSANDDQDLIMNVLVKPDLTAMQERLLLNNVRLALWKALGVAEGNLHYQIADMLYTDCSKKEICETMQLALPKVNKMIETIQGICQAL